MDFATNLGIFLKDTHAATWADVVVLAVMAVFLCASVCAWKGWAHSRKFVEYAPGLMTSLGIFGTFVGVVIGLLNFDTDLANIDQSIMHLLEGLKTAFLTSVVGLLGAISFHLSDSVIFEPLRQRNPETHDVTPSDIHDVLGKQLHVLRVMHLSLSGSEEGSLVGQIKLLKADVNEFRTVLLRDQREFRTELFAELRRFAEMLAESATKQVIEALEQVVRDFNSNLTEQFGENFKALDASVKKMVEWQQEYKTQIETMSEQYQQSVSSLLETRTAVAGIWEECKEIPLAMAELRTVLQVNQHQIAELGRHLEAFAAVKERAVEAVPTIHKRLEEIGDRLVEGSTRMHAVMLEGATEFQDSVNATNASLTGMATILGREAGTMATTLDDAATGFSNSTRNSLAQLESSSKSVLDGVRQSAVDLGAHSDQLRAQFARVVAEYDVEVSKVLQSFEGFGQKLQQEAQRSHDRVAQQMQANADKAMSAVAGHMEAAARKTEESINGQLEAMDKARMRELNRVIGELGSALASITRRFADDYGRFTAYLSDIQKIAQTATRQ